MLFTLSLPPWIRWATARAENVRSAIRAVTGMYNQWPIILHHQAHHLPIDCLPVRPCCLANDNAGD